MSNARRGYSLLRLSFAGLALVVSAAAWSQPYGHGPGMMGPGMMGDYGYGYGMGPGMMGGYGQGPGMMGPGMMGGYGHGPGMMGPGMMGGYAYGIDLSPEQRTKMSEIQQGLAQKHWEMMGKMQQQGYRANDIYRDGKLDEQAARKNYETMAGLRKQMFELQLQAQKEMDALLTPDQRKQWQRRWQGR